MHLIKSPGELHLIYLIEFPVDVTWKSQLCQGFLPGKIMYLYQVISQLVLPEKTTWGVLPGETNIYQVNLTR
jgi:hypothetical protein